MARTAARRERPLAHVALLALLVSAVVLLAATPSVEASRYLPASLTLAEAPALPHLEDLDQVHVGGDAAAGQGFALLTDQDLSLLVALARPDPAEVATVLTPDRYRLFPGSTPPPRRLEQLASWKIASGGFLAGVECNVLGKQDFTPESWWTLDTYAFVGWGPHVGRDPFGECNDPLTRRLCIGVAAWLWGNRDEATALALDAVPAALPAAEATRVQATIGAAVLAARAVDQAVNTITFGAPAAVDAFTDSLLAGASLGDAASAGIKAAADKITYGYATSEDRWQHTKDLLGGAVGADHYSLGMADLVEGVSEGNVEQALRGGSELTLGMSQTVLTVAGTAEAGQQFSLFRGRVAGSGRGVYQPGELLPDGTVAGEGPGAALRNSGEFEGLTIHPGNIAQRQGREHRIDWLEANEFDLKLPRHIRGWLRNERRRISQGSGPPQPRNPPGYVQAHGRTTPAREGFDYSNARLQIERLNKLEERIRRRAGRP